MRYEEWQKEFAEKHRRIVESLSGLDEREIVEYFRYDNMRERHPDFCPLYEKKEKCHDLEDLNCYLCACPCFRYCDEGIDTVDGKRRYSFCAVEARQGNVFVAGNAIHQDCSGCLLPHRRSTILKFFDRDWSSIMSRTRCCPEEEKENDTARTRES